MIFVWLAVVGLIIWLGFPFSKIFHLLSIQAIRIQLHRSSLSSILQFIFRSFVRSMVCRSLSMFWQTQPWLFGYNWLGLMKKHLRLLNAFHANSFHFDQFRLSIDLADTFAKISFWIVDGFLVSKFAFLNVSRGSNSNQSIYYWPVENELSDLNGFK